MVSDGGVTVAEIFAGAGTLYNETGSSGELPAG